MSVSSFSDAIFRLRWWLFAICIGCCVGLFLRSSSSIERLTLQIAQLEENPPEHPLPQTFDSRREIWFPDGNPALDAYDALQKDFVSQDSILIGLESGDPEGVFSVAALREVRRLTDEFEKVPYVRNVRSVVQFPWIRRDDSEGLVVSDLFERDPEQYSYQERVQRISGVLGLENTEKLIGSERLASVDRATLDVLGEPRLLGNLVTRDGRRTFILVDVVKPTPSPEKLKEVLGEVSKEYESMAVTLLQATVHDRVAVEAQKLVDASNAYPLFVTGLPITQRHFNRVGEADMAFVGLMFLVIAIVLVVVFRSLVVPLLPLAVVVFSLVGMMSFVFGIGDLLNNMTAVAPIIIVVVGIADSVHIISVYLGMRHEYTNSVELVREVLRRTILPIVLTSLTTAAGFLSLWSSKVLPIATFGYTVAFGIFLALMFSVTFVPGVLALLPGADPAKPTKIPPLQGADAAWAERVMSWAIKHRVAVTTVTLLGTFVCLFGASRVLISSDVRRFFPSDDPVMGDLSWFEESLGGYGDVELIFHALSSEKSAVPLAENAEFLSELDRLEQRIKTEAAIPESPLSLIVDVSSPLDVLRKMHQVQNGGDANYYRLPNDSDIPPSARRSSYDVDPVTGKRTLIPGQTPSTMVAQYFLQYENGARPTENLSTNITSDRNQFRMSLRVSTRPSHEEIQGFEYLESMIREDFPLISGAPRASGRALASLDVTGQQYLFSFMAPLFNDTLVQSSAMAILTVTLLIMIGFRSLLVGLVSLVPNVLPLVLPLSVMAILGIALDGPTVVVVAIALGVCVDDTIHLTTHVLEGLRRGQSVDEAVKHAGRAVGNPMLWTSVTLALGFGALVFAGFKPNIMTGYLGSSMVILAWAADMLAARALLSLVGKNLSGAASSEPASRESLPHLVGEMEQA